MKSNDVNKEFIKENIGLIDNYDLNSIVDTVIKRKISEDLGVYMANDNTIYGYNNRYRFNDFQTYEDIKKSVENDIKSVFGTIEKYLLFIALRIPSKSVSIDEKNEMHLRSDYNIPLMYISDLLYFLDYIVNGKPNKDFAFVNDLQKKYIDTYSNEGFDITITELNNLKVKRFKNNKLKTSFTAEQIQKIKSIKNEISTLENKMSCYNR